MKKKIIFVVILSAVCLVAGFGGYFAAFSRKPEVFPETIRKENVTLGAPNAGPETEPEAENATPHYLAKIERDMLFIYEMPENLVYDSMKAETLSFPDTEMPELYEGIVFETLPEVYEFLENSMS